MRSSWRKYKQREDGREMVWGWLPHIAYDQTDTSRYCWVWWEPILQDWGSNGAETWTLFFIPTEQDLEIDAQS
jgi:hypothetical protein